MRIFKTHHRLYTGIILSILVLGILTVFAKSANAHQGEHPVNCADVEIPEGYHCHEPGSYNEPVWQDYPDPKWHAVCTKVIEGEGSAIGKPVFIECLPDTGNQVPIFPLTLLGLGILTAGSMLLLRSNSKPS